MNKKLLLLTALALIFNHSILLGQTVNYTASQAVINNPERGLERHSKTGDDYATTVGANNLSVSKLLDWRNGTDKHTVVYRYFMLDAFMNSNINATYLANIENDFNNIRTAGFKCILRFSYSNNVGSGPPQAAKSRMLTHINQLSTVMNNNKDVIFSNQAGFVGTWGEWYFTNSTEFGTNGSINTAQWNNRREITDAMLAATPTNIPLQVRTARTKRALYGNTELTDSTAYQNTPNARFGLYNDAFLNFWGDQGSYQINSTCENPVGNTDYNYTAKVSKYLPMTGETNGINTCNNGFRMTGSNVINEMNLTNWTVINRGFGKPMWDALSTNNYDTILRKLGYRFNLKSSEVSPNNMSFTLDLNIENVGFARPFKKRNVYLVMKNVETNAINTVSLNTDIRTWESNINITQNINLNLEGTYKLYLWMPDFESNLHSNPDYSIQCANMGTWDANTGYNDLQQTVTLSPPVQTMNDAITITAPSANAIFNFGTPVTVTANAFDNQGIDKLRFRSEGKTTYINVPNNSGTQTTYSYTFNNLAIGKHELKVLMKDNASNKIKESVFITVVDNTKNNVIITSPANNTNYNQGSPIVVTASGFSPNGINKLRFSYDGISKYTNVKNNVAGTQTVYSHTWQDLPVGIHKLQVQMKDDADIRTQATEITIIVNPSNNSKQATNSGAIKTNDSEYRIYPTIVYNSLNWKFKEPIASIKIVDVNGKLIRNENVNSTGSINLSELSDGLYIVSFLKENKEVVQQKIIKK